MKEPISKKRKFISAVGGLSLILLFVLLIILTAVSGLPENFRDGVDMVLIFVWAIVLVVIHVCDVMSVFSEKFRIKMRTAEQKSLAVPIAEIVMLILSVIGLFWGMLGVTFLLLVVVVFGGDVIHLLILSWVLAIVMAVNMISIIVSNFKIVSARKKYSQNIPQQAYNYNQQNQGYFNGYPQQGGYNSFGTPQNIPNQNQGYCGYSQQGAYNQFQTPQNIPDQNQGYCGYPQQVGYNRFEPPQNIPNQNQGYGGYPQQQYGFQQNPQNTDRQDLYMNNNGQ